VFDPTVLDVLTEAKVTSGNVRTMEALGQDYGFVLYTTHIRASDPEYTYSVSIEGLHDRADIYADGSYLGTYYRDRENTPVSFRIPAGSVRLDILVENMGRICYGHKILNEHKGITGYVRTNRCAGIVTNWESRSIPCRYPQITGAFDTEPSGSFTPDPTAPYLFRGAFSAVPGVDTHLRFANTNMTRGQVWINGFAVGRYWNIGPQETLYIPGDLLKAENRIEILALYSDGTYPDPQFCDAASLDGLSENAEVVLS
jgi:beta-galactosidase